jgi:precorrin-2 dehydrogenase/sirohydrochlorin ferrochelatase
MDRPDTKSALPVMLDVADWRCVVVGAGPVGKRRATKLAAAGANVLLIDPAEASDLPAGIEHQQKPFATGDLDGARLVVIATGDAKVNAKVEAEAAASRLLINRADDGGEGDVSFMASVTTGPATVAVDSGGGSAGLAKRISQQLADQIAPDDIRLLEAAARWRPRIKALNWPAPRRAQAIARLTDDNARAILAQRGPAGLDAHLAKLLSDP